MKVIGQYKNGNYAVMLFDDGTKIRANDLDVFLPDKPESMDLCITKACDRGCPMCHEAAKPDGAHGDIMHLPFLDSLLPYTEIAIGGGNPLSHPQIFPFLVKLRDMKMIANLTVHQDHFMQNQALLRWLTGRGLIKGLGVSVTKVSDALLSALAEFPNAVVHIINGVIEMDELKKLYDHNIKLLILGYKDFRRGITAHTEETDKRKEQLYELLPELKQHFAVVSFDNLAIRQLDVQRLLSKDEWDRFYMGGDGQFTMYVDAVNMEYTVSSVSIERWPVTDDIQEMFERVRSYG